MIVDLNGNELTYWPITGLIEGQDSEHLIFSEVLVNLHPSPTTDARPTNPTFLYASFDSRVSVWAKQVSRAAPFRNISLYPLDLTGIEGEINVEIFVRALSPISGLERVPISVVVGTSFKAGWKVK